MKLSADHLRRLSALELSGDAFREVLAILAEVASADDARRERQRLRRAKFPRRSSGPSLGQTRDGLGDSPEDCPEDSPGDSPRDGPLSYSLKKESKKERKKERKIPEAKASGRISDLESELFRRGKQVCGRSAGGLIKCLLKAKRYDVYQARSVVETAATKQNPREYVAAAARSNGNGYPNPTMAAFDDLIARAEREEIEGGSGLLDITPGRLESG